MIELLTRLRTPRDISAPQIALELGVGTATTSLTLLVLAFSGVAWVGIGPVVLGPLPAILAVGGVLVGPAAVVGGTLGLFLYQLLHAVVAPLELLEALLFGATVAFVWNSFESAETRERRPLSRLARLTAAVGVASLWTAVVYAFAVQLTGTFSFYPTAAFVALSTALSAVLVGGPFLTAAAVLSKVVDLPRLTTVTQAMLRFRSGTGREVVGPLSAVALGWFVLGSGLSIGFQLTELIPAFHFRLRDLGYLLFLKSEAMGHGGATVQVGLGVACLVLSAFVVRRRLRSEAN